MAADHLDEAGAIGDLNTMLSDRGVIGDAKEEYEAESLCEEGTIDSPTHLSDTTRPGYSKLEVSPSPMGFQGSVNWGLSEGEPTAEDDTEAPDSDEAERMGG